MSVKLVVFACLVAASSAAYNGPLAGGLPAAQYPAGVNPSACPNYPNCANPAVAVNQSPVSQYNAIPQQYNPAPQQYNPVPQQYNPAPQQYNAAPQYNPGVPARAQYSPEVQNALDRGEYIGDGDYHGEGLAEALAPGYAAQQQAYNPQYNPAAQYNQAPQYNPAAYNPQAYAQQPQLPAGVGQPAQVPAGVDARSCPNYPFCS